jgi:O-antigen ligase
MSFTGSIVFYAMVVIPAVCLVIHFIKFPIKQFKFGKMFLPLCVVTASLFLGGMLSPYLTEYSSGLLYSIPLGPVILIVYLYFANYVCYPEDFNLKKYFMLLLVLMGFIASLTFGYYYFNLKVLQNGFFRINEMGWGNVNMAAAVLLTSIPATCYFLTKSKSIFPCLVTVLFFYFVIYLTGSDGCLGISIAFLPFLAFFVYKHLKGFNKKLFNAIIFLCIAGVLAGLILLVLLDKFHIITDLIDKASSDSGRSELYHDAWRVFNECPLFGAGFGYHNHRLYSPISSGGLRGHNSHSTLFQVLASMGIFGFVAYVYYFYHRYSILCKHNTRYHQFAFFSFTLCACYGFIDTVEFSTIPLMITLTLLVLITEFENSNPDTRFKQTINFE